VEQFHLNAPKMKFRRKGLRNKPTLTEKILWKKLKENQVGEKFIRQYSVDNYVLDFYCPNKRLAIEIEGKIHQRTENITYDKYRFRYIEAFGIKILKFTNEEIFNNIQKVLDTICLSLLD
jgi:very-short-patch-repair endonuclease